ncbi:MAG: PAS domain-containing sensor histidine kinase [Rhodobiaceae bacterium]|nr:PAS domain-containing sensor histidine kinase [Rhodobiaceae bacterium]MCC0057360.1 PAS domain-containing sensor histidine kinase [Rhodobiaceae bacterium]
MAVTADTDTPISASKQKRRPVEERLIRSRRATWIGGTLVLLAVVVGVTTFAILTGLTPIAPRESVVKGAVAINSVLVAMLFGMVGWEIVRIWRARRAGIAGARLLIRVMALFSVVAVVPAIIVAVVASVTLDRGLDNWFSDRTKTIIGTSVSIAQAYLREHGQVIRADLLAMAADLNRGRELFDADRPRFAQFFSAQAAIRALPGAYLIKRDLTLVLRADEPGAEGFAQPPEAAMAKAADGEVVVIAPGVTTQVGAVVKLEAFDDLYLYVARQVNQEVINYLRLTRANAAEYQQLEQQRFTVQIAFALMYVGMALILLLSSAWVGIGFANNLVAPIRHLISAAERIGMGELNASVPVVEKSGDLAILGNTFNRMTGQLQSQRDELLHVNDMLDNRRRFMEAVLSGVTAGVIGIDADGMLTVANRSANDLAGGFQRTAIGRPVAEILPEIMPLLDKARHQPQRIQQGQIQLHRAGREQTINVRVAAERSGGERQGFIVTLDDISELVSAQRTSAWADVARRIAHEIKNPLTPIQLSAERIKRKYSSRIETDREVFDQCTDTIIRQVGDIGRMVDEFSSFARMPQATIRADDMAAVIKETVFLMRVGYPEVTITSNAGDTPCFARFDRRLVSQALTNLIKNATEAIEQRAPDTDPPPGAIEVTLKARGNNIIVSVTDNGIGLPAEGRQRLLEPYMTMREKGTGLGLAIVSRIMEDHGGRIELVDAPAVARGGTGATIRLIFPDAAAEAADPTDLPIEARA